MVHQEPLEKIVVVCFVSWFSVDIFFHYENHLCLKWVTFPSLQQR